ncbi:MAG: phenylalanine--tRNA ligase subunit alpha [Candidatus Aenigmarchaeota archaeon]|nr:phenylalanine--tRNA ligase subunit alpha [Candidatus Aenigmarchaeota archaeon]
MSADMARKLHPQERLVLLSLEAGEATDETIARETGLPKAAVNKAGLWLKLKGLIEYKDKKEFKISLTTEGRNYAKNGLPEKILLKVCEKDQSLEELRKKVPELTIALAWAKRNGWIEIDKGKITVTKEGGPALSQKTHIEKALETGETSDEAVLAQLKARKLVTVTETKEKIFALTKEGRELIPQLGAAKEEIGQLSPQDLKTGKWREKEFRPYDIHTPVPTAVPAKMHPYTQFINYTRQKLIALGFKEVKGPYVELEFWNSDALFMPQDHPARGIHDVFRIKNLKKGFVKDKLLMKRVSETHKNGWITGSAGWGSWNQEQTLSLIMRSQTTAASARTLGSGARYGKFFTIDRNFRPDVIDATHSFEFHQCEGIVVGEGMNLRHLLGYLKIFGKEIAGIKEVRFRPGYFPFTEPSVEMDGLVNGKWVELAGSGIFRPEVTLPLGVNVPVLAWGIGFGRLAMIKLGITDMRDLFNHDLEWLKNKRIVY